MVYEPRPQSKGLFARSQTLLDRVLPPQTRSQFYASVNAFAQEQPFLFSFLAILALLTSTPLFLFASFTATTLLFSFITATLFSIFWIGIALLVLVPALFVTTSAAIGVWVWAVSSFVVLRWIYNILPLGISGVAEVHPSMNGIDGKKIVVVKGEGLHGDIKVQNT